MKYSIIFFGICMIQPQICPIGYTQRTFIDNAREYNGNPRSIEVSVWYPAQLDDNNFPILQEDSIWRIEKAYKQAPIQKGIHPLILFSHGFSGSPFSNEWFAAGLAKAGFIVASVKHAGNSTNCMSLYHSFRPWNRPADMIIVLDNLLADSTLSSFINTEKIGMAGFSQGGVTALWIAGAQADLKPSNLEAQFSLINDALFMQQMFPGSDQKDILSIIPTFTAQDFEEANRSYKDERVKGIFSISPGLDERNIIFSQNTLSSILIPTCFVAGSAEDAEELASNTLFFVHHTPKASLHLIEGVAHLTFLNEGNRQGLENAPYLTHDEPDVNRPAIHQETLQLAILFFKELFAAPQ